MYVNYPPNQNTSVLDQQYVPGMQNQQVLFGESLGYNQLNTTSSGGLSVFKFQQGSDYVDSSTLTTKSGVIEGSSDDFCFQRKLQEFQPQILPQLHGLQRQQQNFLNPTVQKKGNSSGQYPPMLDEMPLNDLSRGYINWGQRNASPGQQGTVNRTMFSMGLGSQQLDSSLYGTPVANARGNMGLQPPGAWPPSAQSHNSLMQLSDFNNPFLTKQYDLSPAHVHGFSNETPSDNHLMGNFQKIDTSSKDSSGRQEDQANWSSFLQKDTELSQGLVPLDPLEEKILFNMDDSSISEIASGVFGAKFDNVNFSKPFPSMQSGSWSALMQTALTEASSSDTGLQEDFSSLTDQNIELPADINDISNFMDSDKQHAGYVNNNTLQGSALLNSRFPRFQLPSDQLRSGTFQDENTPDSTQRSLNVSGHWVDCNPQQKILRGNQQVQSGVSFDNLFTGNRYLQSPGMLDQLQPHTYNFPSSTADSSASHLAGMSSLGASQGGTSANVPGHLRKAGTFPHFVQQNNMATVYASQMQTINPLIASQPGNATFPGVHLDAGLGSHTSSQTRSPHQGTNQQFNVWMDLPTRQHPSDQESVKVPLNSTLSGSDVTTWQKAQHKSSTSYNMPQRVGLPQEQGADAKNISVFTASIKDANKVQGETNMEFSTCSKQYEQSGGLNMPMGSGMSSTLQLKSFAFNDPKMEQNVCSSGNNFLASGMEHSQLSLPASAPVWFKQMGAFKNDQLQPALDSQETPNQLTQHSRPLNSVTKQAEIITPKKRKLMKTKQLSWHEEVSNTSQRDHTVSGAEQEWAIVSKLLVEKADYNTQTFGFALPLHRSKRRLVVTSQLMQQLFDPPPAFMLFSAASSSYSTLLFFVARAILGDACSLTHKRENMLPSSSNVVEKLENSERRDVQHSEVAKELTEKAKKLGERFERLENMPLMADIRCEIADLEKFSVINRFARFHSKGPVDNNSGNPSQSSMLKPIPERYVVVRSMPQNVPDGVHCLSL